jgi:glycosyltransferase involved in cell wall biosynthesis
MVARLSHEKGVERAIEAAAYVVQKNLPLSLHIVGDGGMREELQTLARERGIAEQVHFYGEQGNPYRYMKNADLFLLTSYHEAAPMVIEEADVLGLPVLTTRTTSSEEMVIRQDCGWVCENTQESISQTLTEIISDSDALQRFTDSLRERSHLRNNLEAIRSFAALVER